MTRNCKTKCESCRCGEAEGERRKTNAFALLSARREIIIRRAQRALLAALLRSGMATADDVRDTVELPPGVSPKCFGAAPGPLARTGIIRRAGYAPTSRPVGHARPVSVWTLVDCDSAIRWLDSHPELPDPDDQGGASQGVLLSNHPTHDAGDAVAAATPAMEA